MTDAESGTPQATCTTTDPVAQSVRNSAARSGAVAMRASFLPDPASPQVRRKKQLELDNLPRISGAGSAADSATPLGAGSWIVKRRRSTSPGLRASSGRVAASVPSERAASTPVQSAHAAATRSRHGSVVPTHRRDEGVRWGASYPSAFRDWGFNFSAGICGSLLRVRMPSTTWITVR